MGGLVKQINKTWQNRADVSIAQGALTNSKHPKCFVSGVYPTHLVRGEGCYVWDTDGRRYIDFICALGTNLIGYAHPVVLEAVAIAAKKGALLSLGTPDEVELCEQLKAVFPVESLRILSSGTEAAIAAVRIARSTGRSLVVSEGYHGWGDSFVSLTPPAHGVLRDEFIIPMPQTIEAIPHNAAAVFIEPFNLDGSPARVQWLRYLRQYTAKHDIALIFDEVITALRVPGHSVARYSGVHPDLMIGAKALGSGAKISFVGGRRAIMEAADWFVSGTFCGERTAIAAAQATLWHLRTRMVVDDLWSSANSFCGAFNSIWKGIQIEGYGTRGRFVGEPEALALVMQEACRAGILLGPSFFFSYAHAPVADVALSTLRDIVLRVKSGSVGLEGKLPQAPFSAKQRRQEGEKSV